MGCPKQVVERKFLFFRWKTELPHQWKIYAVEERYLSWTITYQCQVCESKTEIDGLKDKDIVRRIGFIPTTGIMGKIWEDDIEEQHAKLEAK
jgi:hypothetical protein